MSPFARSPAVPTARVRLPGVGLGRLVGIAGAAVVVAGLSRPFYTLLAPPGAGAAPAASDSGSSHALGRFFDMIAGGGESAARGAGTGISGWAAFGTLDTVLAAGALLSALLLVAAMVVRIPGGLLRPVWAFGVTGAALVGYRLLERPLPHDLLAVAAGAWIVLAGCLLIAFGGWLAAVTD